MLTTAITLPMATNAFGQNGQTQSQLLPENASPKTFTQGLWGKTVLPMQQKGPMIQGNQQGKPPIGTPPNTCINMSMEHWDKLQGDIKALSDQMSDLNTKHDEMYKLLLERVIPPKDNIPPKDSAPKDNAPKN